MKNFKNISLNIFCTLIICSCNEAINEPALSDIHIENIESSITYLAGVDTPIFLDYKIEYHFSGSAGRISRIETFIENNKQGFTFIFLSDSFLMPDKKHIVAGRGYFNYALQNIDSAYVEFNIHGVFGLEQNDYYSFYRSIKILSPIILN